MRIHLSSKYLCLLAILGVSFGSFGATAPKPPKFTPPIAFLGDGETISNVIANQDFDGDGHKDVVFGDFVTGAVTFELNTDGTGITFGNTATLNFGLSSVTWLAAGNLAHSGTAPGGLPDLAVAEGGSVVVEANQGVVSGTLGFTEIATLSDPNYYFYHVAVGDLNGDGYDDLMVSAQPYGATDAQLIVYMNLGAAGPGFAAPVYYDSGETFSDYVAVGDVNGDGKPDAVLVVSDPIEQADDFVLFTNAGDGDGTLNPPTAYVGHQGSNITSVQIGNLAGHIDGREDIFATTTDYYRTQTTALSERPGFVALVNHGDDTFFLTPTIPAGVPVDTTSPGQTYGSAAIFGSNAGGTGGLAIADPTDGSIIVTGFTASKNSQGLFTGLKPSLTLTHVIPATIQCAQVAVGDLNGDGQPDLVGGVHLPPSGPIITSSTSAVVLLNNSGGGPAPLLAVSATSSAVTGTATIGDEIEYTITYANTGDGAATNVNLGVTIPKGTAYVPGSASDSAVPVILTGTTVVALEWTLGANGILPAHASGTETFDVQVAPALVVGKKLKANIGMKSDEGLAAGKLPVVVVGDPLVLTPGATALSTMLASGTAAAPGDTITYTLYYENQSNLPVANAVLTSTIPGKTKLITMPSATKVKWELGTSPDFIVPAHTGGSETFQVTVSTGAKNNVAITGMIRLTAPGLAAMGKAAQVTANLPVLKVVAP